MIEGVSRRMIVVALGLAIACRAGPCFGESETWRTYRELLGRHFAKSERVAFVRVRPDVDERTRIEGRLASKLAQTEYLFHVARSGQRIDGYAHLGRAPTRYSTFTFAVLFDPRGTITRAEVIEYLETNGSGIRSRVFLRQFEGMDSRSGFRFGRDIDAVTGASISSRSLASGVHRAAVLLSELVLVRRSP